MASGEALRPRPIPQRTCIACRTTAGKREFVRVVRTPEGRVVIDTSGKANGRGAYLHAARACWEKALKRGTISVALKISPAKDDVEALQAFCMALPAEAGNTL